VKQLAEVSLQIHHRKHKTILRMGLTVADVTDEDSQSPHPVSSYSRHGEGSGQGDRIRGGQRRSQRMRCQRRKRLPKTESSMTSLTEGVSDSNPFAASSTSRVTSITSDTSSHFLYLQFILLRSAFPRIWEIHECKNQREHCP
jgi:hypothetical protein